MTTKDNDSGFCCFQCIHTKQVGIVENLGNFDKILGPGFHFINWPLQSVVGRMSLRIQQLDVKCESKTKDSVFIEVTVAVQYRIDDEAGATSTTASADNKKNDNALEEDGDVSAGGVFAAFYRMTNPVEQIQTYVYDVLRNTIPKLELDEAYVSQNDLANAVKEKLSDVMKYYGYQILETLIVDIRPTDRAVINSMNEINASKRMKEAMANKAEANKVQQIKIAEAVAEQRYLQGIGTARQRKAIVQSLQVNVTEFVDEINAGDDESEEEKDTVNPKDAMDILLLTQYMDTLGMVGTENLIVEHDPSFVSRLKQQSSILTSSIAGDDDTGMFSSSWVPGSSSSALNLRSRSSATQSSMKSKFQSSIVGACIPDMS